MNGSYTTDIYDEQLCVVRRADLQARMLEPTASPPLHDVPLPLAYQMPPITTQDITQYKSQYHTLPTIVFSRQLCDI